MTFKTFLLKIKNNNKKIDTFGLNYHTIMVQSLFFAYFEAFLLKIPMLKIFSSGRVTFQSYRESTVPHIDKNYVLSYYCYYK